MKQKELKVEMTKMPTNKDIASQPAFPYLLRALNRAVLEFVKNGGNTNEPKKD